MSKVIEKYIDRVISHSGRTGAEADEIRDELTDHLTGTVEQLESEGGMARDEAVFEAMERCGQPAEVGERLRQPWRMIDIRKRGTAKGVIAIVPRAIGVFASGGVAMGVFTFGGISLGLFSFGGIALGLLFGFGGLATGVIAHGGLALGVLAAGGLALGIVAIGGLAIGLYAPYAGEAITRFKPGDEVPAWMETLASVGRRFLDGDAQAIIHGGFTVFVVLYVTLMLSAQRRAAKAVNPEERSWMWD